MTTKDPRPLPNLNFMVPEHYVEIDLSKAIKGTLGTFGACGLPTPETCGLAADAGRLARYTELFQEAQKLHVPSGLANPDQDFVMQTAEAQEAIVKGWEFLNGPL